MGRVLTMWLTKAECAVIVFTLKIRWLARYIYFARYLLISLHISSCNQKHRGHVTINAANRKQANDTIGYEKIIKETYEVKRECVLPLSLDTSYVFILFSNKCRFTVLKSNTFAFYGVYPQYPVGGSKAPISCGDRRKK